MVSFKEVVLLSALFVVGVQADWCVYDACPWKRAKVFGNPALDVVKREPKPADVAKRQGGGYTYALTSLPDWAALPYSQCGGTTICPNSWHCKCQNAGSSRCMPNPTTAGCSVYAGATDYAQCEFYWPTTMSTHATASGQCGGWHDYQLNQAWSVRTVCPEGFNCACRDFWYSQCLPANVGTACPGASSYWGCGFQWYSSPTALGDQCGGHCFTASGVASACPGGMSCYTQTGSSPGFIAICDTASPTAAGQWDPYARSICYPIPFEWTGAGAPLCGGGKAKRSAIPQYSYAMTKPSRVPANSPAESTPASDFSYNYEAATAGQQITL